MARARQKELLAWELQQIICLARQNALQIPPHFGELADCWERISSSQASRYIGQHCDGTSTSQVALADTKIYQESADKIYSWGCVPCELKELKLRLLCLHTMRGKLVNSAKNSAQSGRRIEGEKPNRVLYANTESELQCQLNQIFCDMCEMKERTREEFGSLYWYCKLGFFPTCPAFPVTVWKGESPDFAITTGNDEFGIEVTSVNSKLQKQKERVLEKRGVKPPYIIPDPVGHECPDKIVLSARGYDEPGSALRRTVAGEIALSDITEYASQINKVLSNKAKTVARFAFAKSVRIVLSINSTTQHRQIRWLPHHLDRLVMILLGEELRVMALEVMAQHPRITEIAFLSDCRLLLVRQNGLIMAEHNGKLVEIRHKIDQNLSF